MEMLRWPYAGGVALDCRQGANQPKHSKRRAISREMGKVLRLIQYADLPMNDLGVAALAGACRQVNQNAEQCD